MSAGAFLRSRYETNDNEIHPIRVQPETVALNIGGANVAAVGAFTSPISAVISRGRRAKGLIPRTVSIVFTAGAPAGYKDGSVIRLPILTPNLWSGIGAGETGTYLGGTVEVVGKSPEIVR